MIDFLTSIQSKEFQETPASHWEYRSNIWQRILRRKRDKCIKYFVDLKALLIIATALAILFTLEEVVLLFALHCAEVAAPLDALIGGHEEVFAVGVELVARAVTLQPVLVAKVCG